MFLRKFNDCGSLSHAPSDNLQIDYFHSTDFIFNSYEHIFSQWILVDPHIERRWGTLRFQYDENKTYEKNLNETTKTNQDFFSIVFKNIQLLSRVQQTFRFRENIDFSATRRNFSSESGGTRMMTAVGTCWWRRKTITLYVW